MTSHDQKPTAGAMRAAAKIMQMMDDRLLQRESTDSLAAIIDRESWLRDLAYCAMDYHDAVENKKSEEWVASTEEDLVKALARVEGGGE